MFSTLRNAAASWEMNLAPIVTSRAGTVGSYDCFLIADQRCQGCRRAVRIRSAAFDRRPERARAVSGSRPPCLARRLLRHSLAPTAVSGQSHTFLTNSDFRLMAPMPSILQSMSCSLSTRRMFLTLVPIFTTADEPFNFKSLMIMTVSPSRNVFPAEFDKFCRPHHRPQRRHADPTRERTPGKRKGCRLRR